MFDADDSVKIKPSLFRLYNRQLSDSNLSEDSEVHILVSQTNVNHTTHRQSDRKILMTILRLFLHTFKHRIACLLFLFLCRFHSFFLSFNTNSFICECVIIKNV